MRRFLSRSLDIEFWLNKNESHRKSLWNSDIPVKLHILRQSVNGSIAQLLAFAAVFSTRNARLNARANHKISRISSPYPSCSSDISSINIPSIWSVKTHTMNLQRLREERNRNHYETFYEPVRIKYSSVRVRNVCYIKVMDNWVTNWTLWRIFCVPMLSGSRLSNWRQWSFCLNIYWRFSVNTSWHSVQCEGSSAS